MILERERSGGVELLRLNRPEVRNAFDSDLSEAVFAAFEELDADPGVQAVVITGAGELSFSAGADLTIRQATEFDSGMGVEVERDPLAPSVIGAVAAIDGVDEAIPVAKGPARIEQGVSIPFLSVSAAGTQTQFVDATLRLEVTPQVTNDGRVLMDIRVTDNAPDPSITGADGQPAIRRNEAETQVLSLNGETIVIGGIFTRTTTDNINGIPWFSRIPLLGFLFRKTLDVDQRRELLVFITPRIIR